MFSMLRERVSTALVGAATDQLISAERNSEETATQIQAAHPKQFRILELMLILCSNFINACINLKGKHPFIR